VFGAPVDRVAWARTRQTFHMNLFFSPLQKEAGGGGVGS